MTPSTTTIYKGGPVFDGERLLDHYALVTDAGIVRKLDPESKITAKGQEIDLKGSILCPGYVDLQVNGGGGMMFNSHPSVETLRLMAQAHNRLGVACLLPTLISDCFETSHAAIEAVVQAIHQGIYTIGGLHLEGPHLCLNKKGAHSAQFIRCMNTRDIDLLIHASERLPTLLVTIAPENVTLEQVNILKQSGIILSLGHTNADYATCVAYIRAGVSCATHLFNAMSQLGSREPGLVGAVLDTGDISTGLIADGMHVHPASVRTALKAKAVPGNIFLVSDAMAVAGSDIQSFRLNGRNIHRKNGCLILEDGTLAGADIDLTASLRWLINEVGCSVEKSLRMVTSAPARVAGLGKVGNIVVGEPVSLIRIARDFTSCLPFHSTFAKVKVTRSSRSS